MKEAGCGCVPAQREAVRVPSWYLTPGSCEHQWPDSEVGWTMGLPEMFSVSEGLVRSPRKVGPPVLPLGSWYGINGCLPVYPAFLFQTLTVPQ